MIYDSHLNAMQCAIVCECARVCKRLLFLYFDFFTYYCVLMTKNGTTTTCTYKNVYTCATFCEFVC